MTHPGSLDEARLLDQIASLASSKTTRAVADSGVRLIAEHFAGAHARIWLYDPAHEELALATSSHPDDLIAAHRLPVGSRTSRVEAIVADSRRTLTDSESIVVPLIAECELMGVLRVDWGEDISVHREAVIEGLARVLANLIGTRHQVAALERHSRCLDGRARLRESLTSLDAHALRTPLAALELALQVARRVLCRKNLDEGIAIELGRALDAAERQCARFSEMLDGVLPGPSRGEVTHPGPGASKA